MYVSIFTVYLTLSNDQANEKRGDMIELSGDGEVVASSGEGDDDEGRGSGDDNEGVESGEKSVEENNVTLSESPHKTRAIVRTADKDRTGRRVRGRSSRGAVAVGAAKKGK